MFQPALLTRMSSRPNSATTFRTPASGKIFTAARSLLERETDGTKFRLLGVGIGRLTTADHADPSDFVDDRAVEAEHAVDRVRARFGEDAVVRGLAFEGPEER